MEFCDSLGQPLDYAGKVDKALLLAKVPGPPWVEDGSVKNYAELVARASPFTLLLPNCTPSLLHAAIKR